MRTIVVVHRPTDWPLRIAGVQVVEAGTYLTDPEWTRERGLRVINLCRSYRYQTEGYYVSLLAAARRHRPFPDLMTVLGMKSRHSVRTVDEELDALIQKSLANLQSDGFELSIYFGKNLAQRHARLAQRLFTLFPAPLQRAQFQRQDRWRMTRIAPIGFRDIPDTHREFVAEAAAAYLGRPGRRPRPTRVTRYDLAILHDPGERLAPSDGKALAKFRRAGQHVGFDVEMIERDDYARVAEFDALFLRETTYVDHHTFRFAQRAEAEGLVVIDDPTSILRCTNKVYQAEALTLRKLPIPKTLIIDGVDVPRIEKTIGIPCVLKHPDSSFSRGVVKCENRQELEEKAAKILDESDLLLVQEFLPTGFDWRIGVFAGEPLYACRYLMAKGHWQVVKATATGSYRYGRVEPVALEDVPPRILKISVRGTELFGDGLSGVDLKVIGSRIVIIEINDNPNIDAGCEDVILKDELYRRIMRGMLERVEAKKRGSLK